jgi:hypothetical protein
MLFTQANQTCTARHHLCTQRCRRQPQHRLRTYLAHPMLAAAPRAHAQRRVLLATVLASAEELLPADALPWQLLRSWVALLEHGVVVLQRGMGSGRAVSGSGIKQLIPGGC